MPEKAQTGCKVEAACRKIAGILLNDLSNLIKAQVHAGPVSSKMGNNPANCKNSKQSRMQTCAPKRHFHKFCLVMDKNLHKNKNPLTVIFCKHDFVIKQSREKRGCQRKPCRASSSERKKPHRLFLLSLTSIPAARSVQAPQGTDVAWWRGPLNGGPCVRPWERGGTKRSIHLIFWGSGILEYMCVEYSWCEPEYLFKWQDFTYKMPLFHWWYWEHWESKILYFFFLFFSRCSLCDVTPRCKLVISLTPELKICV